MKEHGKNKFYKAYRSYREARRMNQQYPSIRQSYYIALQLSDGYPNFASCHIFLLVWIKNSFFTPYPGRYATGRYEHLEPLSVKLTDITTTAGVLFSYLCVNLLVANFFFFFGNSIPIICMRIVYGF